MTTIRLYRNRRNDFKWLEIHEDGEGHRSVRQFIHFPDTAICNLTGDGMLHRWRKSYLDEVLKDYYFFSEGREGFKKWFADSTRSQRSRILRRMRRNRA